MVPDRQSRAAEPSRQEARSPGRNGRHGDAMPAVAAADESKPIWASPPLQARGRRTAVGAGRLTYVGSDIHSGCVPGSDKPLVWLHGEIKTPPFSAAARIEAGELLRRLQRGELLHMPHSRPMPSVGPRCHELRVRDAVAAWRILYRIDPDAIVLVEVFAKKTRATPLSSLKAAANRLRRYDSDASPPPSR